MNTSLVKKLWCLVAAALLVVVVGAAAQEEEEMDPETKARVDKFDKGPTKIDVSKYPPDIKALYKLYTEKCSKCHTIARGINCDFVLDDEWERYIKRMMRRAGSFISPDEGKKLYTFVTYDSKVRKKALYDQKMKAAGK